MFGYYPIGCGGNRFFKVRALVRKNDYEHVTSGPSNSHSPSLFYLWMLQRPDKLVSKSIEFVEECTMDEIFTAYGNDKVDKLDDELRKQALIKGIEPLIERLKIEKRTRELIELGYSEVFSQYIAKDEDEDKYERACAVAAQPDVSMDVRILAIFCDNDD